MDDVGGTRGRRQKRQIGEIRRPREDKEGCRRGSEAADRPPCDFSIASLHRSSEVSAFRKCLPQPNFENRKPKQAQEALHLGEGAEKRNLLSWPLRNVRASVHSDLGLGGAAFGSLSISPPFAPFLPFPSMPPSFRVVRRRCRTMRGLCSARHRETERRGTVFPLPPSLR